MPGPTFDKRWFRRAQRWVAPTDRPLFDARRFSVDVLAEGRAEGGRAERFVVEHHYSGTMTSTRLAVGLFGPRAQLVGVAVLGESAGPAVLPKYAGPLRDQAGELGRFVCLPDVGYNGETWFLARAFRLARREKGIRAVLSFADPVAREEGGQVVKPEHWGTIYQASNALHVGRALARSHLVAPDGRVLSPRALSKLRTLDRGWEYAERQLLDAGAPRRRESETPLEWIVRVRLVPGFTTRRHPGNLAYVFGLDEQARAELRAHHRGRIAAYPRGAGQGSLWPATERIA